MATDLNFTLSEQTASDDFVLFEEGGENPYPGFKIKVLREEREGVLINKILREVTGTVDMAGTDFKTKILLEVVDGDDTPPNPGAGGVLNVVES